MADGDYISKINVGKGSDMTLLIYPLKLYSNIATHYKNICSKTRYFIPSYLK